jgi:hypothetical protein
MSLTRGRTVIKSFAERLPESPGVYQMRGEKGEYLYIGKARALRRRVTNYTNTDALPLRLQRMVSETVEMNVTMTETEAEALLLESMLIKTHKPKYNVLLQDDKSFPYLVIDTTHDFPQLAKHRGSRDKGKLYFGPFASADAVNKEASAWCATAAEAAAAAAAAAAADSTAANAAAMAALTAASTTLTSEGSARASLAATIAFMAAILDCSVDLAARLAASELWMVRSLRALKAMT